jgi:CO dehydrogenase/acetyl-CoA synthase epsilon subunit
MFLAGAHYIPSQFNFLVDHGVSCDRMAVETEISFLTDVDVRGVSVDITGDYIVLEGTTKSLSDSLKIESTAKSVVGTDRVMSRLVALNG